MPGGNGTGPAGMGPMTGRGAGFCAGYGVPGYANPVGGRGMGMGFGGGRGMGRGRGFGRGFGWTGIGFGAPVWSAVAGSNPALTATQELDSLKQQAGFLQDSLTQVTERIEQLEKESKK